MMILSFSFLSNNLLVCNTISNVNNRSVDLLRGSNWDHYYYYYWVGLENSVLFPAFYIFYIEFKLFFITWLINWNLEQLWVLWTADNKKRKFYIQQTWCEWRSRTSQRCIRERRLTPRWSPPPPCQPARQGHDARYHRMNVPSYS